MKRLLIILLTGSIILAACNDPWEDRFNKDIQTTQTVWEILNQDQDYDEFVQLLKETGYDSILQQSTVFTLFVPENSSLQTLSSLSLEEKTTIIGFHISNSIIYSPDVKGITPVKTLNGKQLFLELVNGEVMVNQDTRIVQGDIRAVNGVIYKIDKVQQIKLNIFELIQSDTSFSHIADFILEGSELIFDEANSLQVGIDSIGQTIYDSVWISTNDFFSQFADLSSEDQSFSVLLADNMALDTTENGAFLDGYLVTLPRYIFKGIFAEDDFNQGLVSVNGRSFAIPESDLSFYANASNGVIYTLNSVDNISIPVSLKWDITNIADFDSIRGIKTTDYIPYLNDMEDLRISSLDGAFLDFKYELKGGLLNGDQLKILTQGGTDASIEIDLCEILPGKYRLSVNALIRVADGITYDAYLNNKLISSSNNFNGGLYKNETREIGEIVVTESTGNVFRINIKDSSSTNRYCFIDYLLFEPIK